jgi:hypothetical protein
MSKKLEFISALQIFLWGLWLLLPFDSFASSKIFMNLEKIAPEWAWGFAAVVIGASWVFCRNLKIRSLFALLTIMFWSVITLTYMQSNFMSTATVVYPTLILIASMAFNEINKEAKWMQQE